MAIFAGVDVSMPIERGFRALTITTEFLALLSVGKRSKVHNGELRMPSRLFQLEQEP